MLPHSQLQYVPSRETHDYSGFVNVLSYSVLCFLFLLPYCDFLPYSL